MKFLSTEQEKLANDNYKTAFYSEFSLVYYLFLDTFKGNPTKVSKNKSSGGSIDQDN